MTHAEKQDGDFHGSMFNDLYDTTNWRMLGEKNTKGDIIAATLLSALPGNYAATKGDTVAAEYATCVDQTKNELNMCTSTAAHHCAQGGMAAREIGATAIRAFAVRAATGLILGDAANKFDGVTKKNDEYETGTKNDGTASAPFGKQPRRYGLPVVLVLLVFVNVWRSRIAVLHAYTTTVYVKTYARRVYTAAFVHSRCCSLRLI